MKYNEERIIEEISRYIKGTYGEHYSKVQKMVFKCKIC